MATLIITEGPAQGEHFALETHRVVMVGRDEKCTFQVIDEKMSRRHMQIKQTSDDQTHSAIDFGSTNGVSINGSRIEDETPLNDGDAIHLGGTTMVYTTIDSPDAATIDEVARRRGQGWNTTVITGSPSDATDNG